MAETISPCLACFRFLLRSPETTKLALLERLCPWLCKPDCRIHTPATPLPLSAFQLRSPRSVRLVRSRILTRPPTVRASPVRPTLCPTSPEPTQLRHPAPVAPTQFSP